MMGIIVTTVVGSVTGALLTVISGSQNALPLDVILAYLVGGLAGFALAVALRPVSTRYHTEP
ncbi:MAG: hypothetical protein ACK4GC_00040 [Paracoccaceae bacterium]